MYELPLFPLNTVLFPGVPIFLHIFEDRYKQMIHYCLDEDLPFGVVLIKEGVEAYGSAEPHPIGCTAQIVNVERLQGGRMNIVAVGMERIRVLNTNHELSYMRGLVHSDPLRSQLVDHALLRARRRLIPHIDRYISILRELCDITVSDESYPSDPIELAYLAAYVLQVPIEMKQAFLAIDDPVALLEKLCIAYRTELSLIRHEVEVVKQRERRSPDVLFSMN